MVDLKGEGLKWPVLDRRWPISLTKPKLDNGTKPAESKKEIMQLGTGIIDSL